MEKMSREVRRLEKEFSLLKNYLIVMIVKFIQ